MIGFDRTKEPGRTTGSDLDKFSGVELARGSLRPSIAPKGFIPE